MASSSSLLVRQELSDMPMGELLGLQDKMGLKAYKEKVLSQFSPDEDESKPTGAATSLGTDGWTRPSKGSRQTHLNNKNLKKKYNDDDKPLEISSKRIPKSKRCSEPFRNQTHDRRYDSESSSIVAERRDPRFDPRCGEFHESKFKTNYEFIGDLRNKERSELAAMLRRERDPDLREQIKYLIQRMDNQDRETKRRGQAASLKSELVSQITNKATPSQGRRSTFQVSDATTTGIDSEHGNQKTKRTHFVSKGYLKKAELAKQFTDLKRSGKLPKYLERKRKRLSQDEKRQRPPRGHDVHKSGGF